MLSIFVAVRNFPGRITENPIRTSMKLIYTIYLLRFIFFFVAPIMYCSYSEVFPLGGFDNEAPLLFCVYYFPSAASTSLLGSQFIA